MVLLGSHGKVKHLNRHERTAVIKFETGEKASRAFKALQGTKLGPRQLLVDFNERDKFLEAGKYSGQLENLEYQRGEVVVNNKRVQSKSPARAAAAVHGTSKGGKPVAAVRAVNFDQV